MRVTIVVALPELHAGSPLHRLSALVAFCAHQPIPLVTIHAINHTQT